MRGNNWLKASIKPFITMFNKTKICSVGKKSFDGSFGKWRSVTRHHAQIRQKLRERNKRVSAFRVFFKCQLNNTSFSWMRFDIMCTRIVLIPERCEIQPFSTAQFLADATLDILGKVIGIIFALPERH